MKKSLLIGVAIAAVVAVIAIIIAFATKKEKYPKIVYIDNELYYGTDKVCEVVPRKMPDGIIETIIESEIMPDSPNSANFGAEYGNMEYMFLEDGQLIVHEGEKWFYFEASK